MFEVGILEPEASLVIKVLVLTYFTAFHVVSRRMRIREGGGVLHPPPFSQRMVTPHLHINGCWFAHTFLPLLPLSATPDPSLAASQAPSYASPKRPALHLSSPKSTTYSPSYQNSSVKSASLARPPRRRFLSSVVLAPTRRSTQHGSPKAASRSIPSTGRR